MKIHQTAIIDKSAEISEDVEIGPYTIIGENVKIGKNTCVAPHAIIKGPVTIGENCKIYQFSSIGEIPQDLKFKGEHSELIIGDNNVFREFTTINRATAKGGGKTIIGNNNFFMAYCHVAHDCIIGNNVIMANAATLAGHITIEDNAIIGGLSAIHQFVRVGKHAIIGGASAVPQDVPPFLNATGNRATLHGLNNIGLKRQGFSDEEIHDLKTAYKIIFRSKLTLKKAFDEVAPLAEKSPHVKYLVDFLKSSERGFLR